MIKQIVLTFFLLFSVNLSLAGTPVICDGGFKCACDLDSSDLAIVKDNAKSQGAKSVIIDPNHFEYASSNKSYKLVNYTFVNSSNETKFGYLILEADSCKYVSGLTRSSESGSTI